MPTTWVIVAESHQARIFSLEHPSAKLHELEDLTRPAARLKNQELRSDSHGRSFDSGGFGRHAMSTETSPKKHEAIMFAKQITDRLEGGHSNGEFAKLIIVAAPEFLGLLRKKLHPSLQTLVVTEIDKNLGRADPATIKKHLPRQF